jgi:hypothetical protein
VRLRVYEVGGDAVGGVPEVDSDSTGPAVTLTDADADADWAESSASDSEAMAVREPRAAEAMSTVAVTPAKDVPAAIGVESVDVQVRTALESLSAQAHPTGVGAGVAKFSPLCKPMASTGSLYAGPPSPAPSDELNVTG